MIKGRSLELFFIDGRPDGLLTAEVFNWTGHILRIPRTQIAEGLARHESKQSGVYVLLGEKDGTPCAYVGEAEKFNVRMKDHVSKKDWWDTVVLVTTTGDLLHKAHIKYLEARLYEIAEKVSAVNLDNNKPPKSSLSEAATASMEGFLETLNMVLPAIRVDVFQQKAKTMPPDNNTPNKSNSNPEFVLKSTKLGVSETAVLIDGEIVVKSGSQGRANWVGTKKHTHSYQNLQKQLHSAGVVEIDGKTATFVLDYAFSSVSAAAAAVLGRAANGRTEWKLRNSNVTYAEWEETNLKNSEELAT